jgi:uncharacterized membrane protein (DUF373 family)
MQENRTTLDYIVQLFSLVPMALYMVVAVLLTFIAVFSVYEAIWMIGAMIVSHDFANGLVQAIDALLLTITIIILFETVTVYFRTRHVDVRTLLVAGFTGLVRQVIVYNTASADPIQTFAIVVLLAVLIAGIVLVKSEMPYPA